MELWVCRMFRILESLTFSTIDLGIVVIPPNVNHNCNTPIKSVTYMNWANTRTKTLRNQQISVSRNVANYNNAFIDWRALPHRTLQCRIFWIPLTLITCSTFWDGSVVWRRCNHSSIIKSRSGPVLVTNESEKAACRCNSSSMASWDENTWEHLNRVGLEGDWLSV